MHPSPLSVFQDTTESAFSTARSGSFKLRKSLPGKQPLSSVGGVYVIMDTAAGKPYIGSAYGDGGYWQRWQAYAESGHGGNTELKRLLAVQGDAYSANFQYSVLEIADPQSSFEQVCAQGKPLEGSSLSRVLGYNSN